MKIELKKKTPLKIVIIIASILTFVFALISIIYGVKDFALSKDRKSIMAFNILTQGSLSLYMLFNGIDCFINKKQKINGLIFSFVFIFNLFVVLFSIYVWLHKYYFL